MNAPDFETQLQGFATGAQEKINTYYKTEFPSLEVPILELQRKGGRYIRVVTRRQSGSQGGSVYCFIDTKEGPTRGNILKAAGWKAPAPNGVRGSIMAADFGLSCVDHHGCIYLR